MVPNMLRIVITASLVFRLMPNPSKLKLKGGGSSGWLGDLGDFLFVDGFVAARPKREVENFRLVIWDDGLGGCGVPVGLQGKMSCPRFAAPAPLRTAIARRIAGIWRIESNNQRIYLLERKKYLIHLNYVSELLRPERKVIPTILYAKMRPERSWMSGESPVAGTKCWSTMIQIRRICKYFTWVNIRKITLR